MGTSAGGGSTRSSGILATTAGPSTLSADEREAILRQRAELLAQVPKSPPTDAFSVVVFQLGSERYAVPLSTVREVRRIDGLTPVPGTPPFVAGLMAMRGRIVPVLDLRPVLGDAADGEVLPYVLVIGDPNAEVGVAISPPQLGELRASEIGPLHSGAIPGLDARCIRGVTSDLVIVLDLGQFLASLQVQVDDELENGGSVTGR